MEQGIPNFLFKRTNHLRRLKRAKDLEHAKNIEGFQNSFLGIAKKDPANSFITEY